MNIHVLTASGFAPVEYHGQQGTFYTKKLCVAAMPYMRTHAIDQDTIFETTEMVVEVTPDGRVQMTAIDTDYVEEPVGIDTEDGAGLLRDAGVDVELFLGKGT
ncbi:hypothetical protein [Paraburkholderia humisilvae]|uniref:Uncharacterized protein n=1 Tax=Paraburkholderia humisilvae TaxID=627669 RepID=A0A6J5DJR9_9BURK|nr:hypothetical protein [Paraburkholderia humisilvae]CAB3754193.1 hypothetical protein LMG29542_02275 [Paraburkholderia humisilvae]